MAYSPIHRESDVKVLDDLDRLDWTRITGRAVLSANELSRQDVGMSFEPRLQVNYDIVYGDGETVLRRVLLVLDKDERTVVSVNLDYKGN